METIYHFFPNYFHLAKTRFLLNFIDFDILSCIEMWIPTLRTTGRKRGDKGVQIAPTNICSNIVLEVNDFWSKVSMSKHHV